MAESRSSTSNVGRRINRRKRNVQVELLDLSSSSSSSESIIEVIDLTKKPPESIVTEVTTDTAPVECAVCLQVCVHPARLPCGHIFCFLCLKGIANQSKRCAMCRQEIPSDYLERPDLVHGLSTAEKEEETFEDGYQWFYEGRNGWWQYDERTSRELETSYKAGDRTCELLIAGFLYIADFDAMLQFRRYEPARRRRIKRDLASIPKKGIAGIRLQPEQSVDIVSQQLNLLSISDEQTVPTTSNEE